ncbi:hypothetical protein ACOMHN_060481 [Nucella lapillus]
MKSVAPSCMTSRLDMDVPDACSGICMTASPARSESQSDSEEMQAWFTKLMQLVPETRADRQTDKTRLLEDVMDYINYLADIAFCGRIGKGRVVPFVIAVLIYLVKSGRLDSLAGTLGIDPSSSYLCFHLHLNGMMGF